MLKLREFDETPESLAEMFCEPLEKLAISEIVAGHSDGSGYEEWIWVLFIGTDGQLYEVSASHCSCYGYEDQWCPQATSWTYLASNKFGQMGFDDAEKAAVRELAREHGG